MTEDTPKNAGQQAQITITGLENVHVGTLAAIIKQLHDGARLWRYGKRAQMEMVQFAEAFETEMRRRGPAAYVNLMADRLKRTKQGSQL